LTKELHILVLEDDPGSQKSIELMLDAEGWKVTVLSDASAGMQELAKGTWALAIASLSLVSLGGPLFQILKELAQAAPVEEGRSRLRVLFVVPENEVANIIPTLEQDRLPYATKPYHFNDFMEKVNDLLIQAQFIGKTARERGFAFEQRARTKSGKPGKKAAAASSMFASRDEYYYTEEELAEYERQQSDEEKKKKKSKLGERPI
jgi:DNA-binding response OmpR family regulator